MRTAIALALAATAVAGSAALAGPRHSGLTCQTPERGFFNASSAVTVSVCVVDRAARRRNGPHTGDLIMLVERQNAAGRINVSATCAVSIPLTPYTMKFYPYDFKVANVPLTLEAHENAVSYAIEPDMNQRFVEDWKHQGENSCSWTALRD